MSGGLILGIESSCDETAAAVVERGSRTLSSVVASQIATHLRYGGVVPELASREHLRAIVPVVRAALADAKCTISDVDAIAVTSGPGTAVTPLEAHIHAVLLKERSSSGSQSIDDEPALALVVSGGHTHLYLARPT